MNKKITDTITRHNMLAQGDHVVVGLSGGGDSMALLHLLLSLVPTYNLRITAAHVNHNLRGAESARDQAYVEKTCQQLGVPLSVYDADITAQAALKGKGIEETARLVRYRFFTKLACGTGKIATAHTATDNAETILFHLVRGTGLKGLCGIPAVRENIIRPLIACTRPEIEAYLAQNNINYVTDSSNLSTAYTRNFIRLQIMPLLRQINPNLDTALHGLSQRLIADESYLQAATMRAKKRLVQKPYTSRLSRIGLLKTHPAVQSRLLADLLASKDLPCNSTQIAQMTAVAKAGSGATQLGKYLHFTANTDTVQLRRSWPPFANQDKQPAAVQLPTTIGQSTVTQLGHRCIKITRQAIPTNYLEKVNKSLLNNLVDCDTIEGMFFVRHRQEGDYINIPGRGVGKSLKKLFNEAKLPPLARGRLIIGADAKGLLWLEGTGPDTRGSITKATNQAFCIECYENREGHNA